VVYAGVPRLGLSAAVHCDDTAKHSAPISGPSRKARTITARDPHLAPNDVAVGDGTAKAIVATGGEIVAEESDNQLLEPGAPPPTAASSSTCSPLDSSGAFRLMIEAIQARTNPAEIEQKL
jgi:hypothetical protein